MKENRSVSLNAINLKRSINNYYSIMKMHVHVACTWYPYKWFFVWIWIRKHKFSYELPYVERFRKLNLAEIFRKNLYLLRTIVAFRILNRYRKSSYDRFLLFFVLKSHLILLAKSMYMHVHVAFIVTATIKIKIRRGDNIFIIRANCDQSVNFSHT